MTTFNDEQFADALDTSSGPVESRPLPPPVPGAPVQGPPAPAPVAPQAPAAAPQAPEPESFSPAPGVRQVRQPDGRWKTFAVEPGTEGAPVAPATQPAPTTETPPPPRRTQVVPGNVLSALQAAASETGVPVTYLTNVARVESAFDPSVKAKTSSATGLFQFIDQTWLSMIRKHGAEKGLAAEAAAITTDARGRFVVSDPAIAQRIFSLRVDPALNSFMGARFAQANGEHLRSKLGRDPSDTDLYMAHFLGAGGAVKFLQGMTANGNDTAAAHVSPDSVSANRSIFFTKDGQPRTLQQVYDLFGSKLTGRGGDAVAGPNINGRSPIPMRDLSAPARFEPGRQWTEADREIRMMQNGRERGDILDGIVEGFRTNLTGRLISLATASNFTPEPGFRLDPKVDLKDIPDEFLPRFSSAVSRAQVASLRAEVTQDMATREQLASAGWGGTTGLILGAIADPGAIGIGIASGGLATAAQGAFGVGRGGGRLMQGLAGAGGNLAIDSGIYAAGGDAPSTSQLLISAGLGAAFGAAFGRLASNPALAEEAATMTAVGRALASRENADSILATGSAVTPGEGAAEMLGTLAQGDVAGAKAGAIRFSVAGQTGRSENVVARAVGSALFTDLVGKGVVQNTQAADQAMQRVYQANFHRWRSAAVPLYDEWAQSRGLNMVERSPLWRRGWNDFNDEITAYVRNTDPTIASQFHPSVQKAGNEKRAILAEYARRLQESGVAGAEGLEEAMNYVPRLWSVSKIDEALRRFSQADVERVVASSLMRNIPDLEDKIALKMAKATIEGGRLRAIEGEDRLSMLFRAAGDEAKLTAVLMDEFGLELDEVKSALAQLRSTEPAKDARLRRRMDLDENYVHTFDNGTKLAVSELLENNADALMGHYIRKMSGRIALAETKVHSHVDGRLIMNGIRSDSEFEQVIREVQKAGMGNPEQTAKDIENLRWGYDRILGRPDPAALGETAQWLRLVRNFNFARLMGQIGLAQMMDIGRAANSAGIKSFMQHIGGFKRIKDADGKFILKHGIDRELEAMAGMGGDRLRGFVALNLEDPGGMRNLDRGKFVDKANAFMDTATFAVAEASGMNYINQWLTLVSGRIAAQKFANIATKKNLSRADRNLLSFLGLNDEQLDRVLGQVRSNFSYTDGALFGRKVTQMNLDKWADAEARALFEGALFRFSRSAVQHSDIGAMAKVMSHPMAQTILQFRSYALTAYENQLLQGAMNPDMRQAMMAAGSTLTGGLVYMAQVHLQAIGRSDAQDFVDKRLGDPMKLGLAVFQRTGFSSIIPMVADSVASFTPMGPIFDARTTGQPSDFIFGNPSVGLVKDLTSVSKALMTGMWNGTPITQDQARDFQRILILGNSMPLLQMYNGLISGMPSR